ncbi:MAG: diguanylate cyclase [Lysobacteraceae bacterium]
MRAALAGRGRLGILPDMAGRQAIDDRVPRVSAPGRGVAALLGAVACGLAAASDTHLNLQRYGLDEGLSQSAVTALVEDEVGFLWVGTQEGLNRFDGERFVVQRRDAGGRGPVSNSVDALAYDDRQRLWIGTNDAGLEVLDLRSGERLRVGPGQGLSHPTVGAVLLDGTGGAWLGTSVGIDHVDAGVSGARPLMAVGPVVGMTLLAGEGYALDAGCRLYRLQPDQATVVTSPGTEGNGGCVALVAGDGVLWLASRSGALWSVDAQGVPAGRYSLQSPGPLAAELTALAKLGDGALVAGFGDGSLLRVRPGDGSIDLLKPAHAVGGAVSTLLQTRGGVLMIGTHTQGLLRAQPLPPAIRRDAFPDATVQSRWPGRSVRAFLLDGGRVLAGTDTGLAWRDVDGVWRTVAELGATSIRALVPDGTGGWWVGSHRGLWRMSADGALRPVDGLPDSRVTAVLVDGGTVWVATRGGLARVTDGAGATTVGLPEGLDGVFLTSLMRDEAGRLWIGSNERGLFRLWPDGRLEELSPENGRLPHNSIWAVTAHGDSVWLGTFSGGLLRLHRADESVEAYGIPQGLSNEVVYAVLPDRSGRLWMSTNNGLSILDPGAGLVQTLGARDGLRNREFNSGAAFPGDDGLMYFGGTEGMDVIDPAALPALSHAAVPVLARFEVLGVRGGLADAQPARHFDVLHGDTLRLHHRDSVLALDMVAIDLAAPQAARLRYRIHGIHADWVPATGAHAELVLSHLPPGRYRLEIQAAGRDGRFGASREVVLELPAPPWRHPLAWTGYLALVLLAMAWLASRAGARDRERQARIELLDRTVAERTAELERANTRLRESNQQLDVATRTDPLTQVSNRRDLQRWLAEDGVDLVRAAGARDPAQPGLLFVMLDIDDFKHINDTHGHQVGDEVLVAFAGRLRRLSRERDVVVRWGGEEFLWVARDVRRDDVAALIERARQCIAGEPFQLSGGVRLAVTCSVGFAPWPFSLRFPQLGDWEQSVNLADRALYAAKAAGKNAWVGVLPGGLIDRAGLLQLLAGASPQALAAGSAEVLSSTPQCPEIRAADGS